MTVGLHSRHSETLLIDAEFITEGVLFQTAHNKGMQAGRGHRAEPMFVRNNDTGEQWQIDDGVCGFASVIVKPARGKFVKFMKKYFGEDVPRSQYEIAMCHKSYLGGLAIPCMKFGQSMEKKRAYCRAFANVLQDAGINAEVTSRMD